MYFLLNQMHLHDQSSNKLESISLENYVSLRTVDQNTRKIVSNDQTTKRWNDHFTLLRDGYWSEDTDINSRRINCSRNNWKDHNLWSSAKERCYCLLHDWTSRQEECYECILNSDWYVHSCSVWFWEFLGPKRFKSLWDFDSQRELGGWWIIRFPVWF